MVSIEIKISSTIYSNNSFCYNKIMEGSMVILCQCVCSQGKREIDPSIANCFFVGMTEVEYDEQIATRFSETQLSGPFHMNKREALAQYGSVKNSGWLKDVLKTHEIPEISIVIKRDLSSAFLVSNDYPFSPFWDDASPWENYPITEINQISEIKELSFYTTSVEITQGNITDQNVDVITNSIGENLSINGALSSAIFRVAGNNLMLEACRKNVEELNNYKAILTDGFDLPAKKVVHVSVPKYKDRDSLEYLSRAVRHAISCADKNGYQSIAIPILGIGDNKYPTELAIQTIIHAAYHSFPKSIQLIRIVCSTAQIYEIAMRATYQNEDVAEKSKRIRISRQKAFIKEACSSSAIYYFNGRKYLPSVKFNGLSGELFFIDRSRHLDCIEQTLPDYDWDRDFMALWDSLANDKHFLICEAHNDTASIMFLGSE